MFTLVTVFCSSFFSNMSHNSHSFEEKEVKKKHFGTRFRAVLYLSLVAPAALGTFALGQSRKYYLFHTSRMLGSPVLQVQNTGPLHFFLEHSLAGYLLFFLLKKILHLHSTGTW